MDFPYTLESVIDVGQGISVGPGKFAKKNKRRALNIHVLCSNLNKLYVLSNKTVGPGKKSKSNESRAYIYYGG